MLRKAPKLSTSKRLTRIVALSALIVVVFSATAQAASEYGSASRWPWSGYWWPMYSGYKNLYDNGEALQAYDTYVQATRGTNPGSQSWESANRRTDDPANEWWGHCHAWAAASILTQEPPASLTKAGVNFDTDDLRGLVTQLYYNPKYTWLSGTRSDTNNQNSAAYKDIAPAWFDWLMRYYVGYYRYPFIMDISADSEVWNFPAFAYTRDVSTGANGSQNVTMTVWYSSPDDGVTGTRYFSRTYTYTLSNGSLGSWTGNSVTDHPDFAWLPSGKYDNGSPVKENIVEEIIGNGYNA